MINNNYIGEVVEGEDGELAIQLPVELINQMGWDEGTLLEWMMEEETVILKEQEDARSSQSEC